MTAHRPPRGIALIEAMVAFAVLSIAVLAALRWQTHMHLHADVSRQRSDAVQQAHQAIEQWRAFTTLDPKPGTVAYADVSPGRSPLTGPSTLFDVLRGVQPDASARLKHLTLDVAWLDRAGMPNTLQVASAIDGTLPVHSAALLVPSLPPVVSRPHGRATVVPPDAMPLADGLSLWQASAPAGTDDRAAASFISDADGRIVALCARGAATRPDESPATGPGCQRVSGAWLTGHVLLPPEGLADGPRVRGSRIAATVHVAHFDAPGAGFAPACAASPVPAPQGENVIRYACAMPLAPGDGGWSGQLSVNPTERSTPSSPAQPAATRLCGHGPAIARPGTPSARAAPAEGRYAGVTQALAHQNYRAVRSSQPCPGGAGPHHNAASTDLHPHPP